jgi:hypothetical protein
LGADGQEERESFRREGPGTTEIFHLLGDQVTEEREDAVRVNQSIGEE